MPNVAGIDVGLTLIRRSSGVCRTGDKGFHVGHTYIDTLSRIANLLPNDEFDVIGVDGPVLPIDTLHYEVRPCEKVFVWRSFQRRCKPGESHIRGTGQALRRAGCETTRQFSGLLTGVDSRVDFPRIQVQRNIVESFPNGFLGVLLPNETYEQMPALHRNEKFDWLMDQCVAADLFTAIQDLIAWPDHAVWSALRVNPQHDERAALICALTAACVWQGRYVAVGEAGGGYFFLPPWESWQDWAKTALNVNRRDRRLPALVDVWIDGVCYSSDDSLPDLPD